MEWRGRRQRASPHAGKGQSHGQSTHGHSASGHPANGYGHTSFGPSRGPNKAANPAQLQVVNLAQPIDPSIVLAECKKIVSTSNVLLDKGKTKGLLTRYNETPSQMASLEMLDKFWLISRINEDMGSVFLSNGKTDGSRVLATDIARKPKLAVNKYIHIVNRISEVHLQKILQEMRECFDPSSDALAVASKFITALQSRVAYSPAVGAFVENLTVVAGRVNMLEGIKSHLSALELAYEDAISKKEDMYVVDRIITRLQAIVYVAFNCDAQDVVFDALTTFKVSEDVMLSLLLVIKMNNLRGGDSFIKKSIEHLLPKVLSTRSKCVIHDKLLV